MIENAYGANDAERFGYKSAAIQNFINEKFSTLSNAQVIGYVELHRLIIQLMMKRLQLSRPTRAVTLNNLNCLILTTNYDTLIEDSLSLENINRFSVSHVDVLDNFGVLPFTDFVSLGPGIFHSSKNAFVVHLNGRYFDVGQGHGFCLSLAEYSKIQPTFLEFMVPIARANSLIFLGAKETIFDSNFKALWAVINNDSVADYPKHYVICSDENVDPGSTLSVRIDILSQNPEYSNLRHKLFVYAAGNHDFLWTNILPDLST